VEYEIAAIIHSSGWLWINILLMCEYYFCEVQWKNDLPIFLPLKEFTPYTDAEYNEKPVCVL